MNGTFVLNDKYRGEYDDYSKNELISMIHKMSQLVVHADEKWGMMDLTANHVNAAILITLAVEIKGTLMEYLVLWKRNDYSQSDKLHNLGWYLQDGTVGYATVVNSSNQTS